MLVSITTFKSKTINYKTQKNLIPFEGKFVKNKFI